MPKNLPKLYTTVSDQPRVRAHGFQSVQVMQCGLNIIVSDLGHLSDLISSVALIICQVEHDTPLNWIPHRLSHPRNCRREEFQEAQG